jgi:hypothetical protein
MLRRRKQIVPAAAHQVAFVDKRSRRSLNFFNRIIDAGNGIVEAVRIPEGGNDFNRVERRVVRELPQANFAKFRI